MKLSYAQELVLSYIEKGKDNAIRISDIIDHTGLSRYEIKYIIMDLREEYPICSGNEGYWLGTKSDMKKCIKEFTVKMETKKKVIHKMNKVMEAMLDED